MIKKFLNEVKMSRLSYLLEIIEVRDFKSKLKALNSIRKMKIDRDSGLMILDKITVKSISLDDSNIYLSLLSILINNFYIDYAPKIETLFINLSDDSKYDILNILSLSKKEDSVYFYRDLVTKYYDGSFDLPIGTLSTINTNYYILFPELFKVLDLKVKRNKVLLLLIDFINLNVVTVSDLKENKKYIQNAVNIILKEGVNYKSEKEDIILKDDDYFNLRIMLEAAINIEHYITNKTSKDYLSKLLKKEDNQLKLFILENYVKKGMDISKINLNNIAKDPLSRYPLYSFLMFYNLERLMPKKFATNMFLSESDLIINYSIKYVYKIIPYDVEFIEERIIDNSKYYIFKFKTNYNYDEEVIDPSTDYILKSTSLDKKIKNNTYSEFIGISGGFNVDLDPSLIEKELKEIIVEKIDIDINTTINKALKQIEKNSVIVKNKTVLEDIEIKENNDELDLETKSKLRKIFSVNTLFILLSILNFILIFLLINLVNGNDILNITNGRMLKDEESSIKATTNNNENFNEINFKELFKKEEKEYYVLIFKKKDLSIYYSFINTLIDNKYRIYYIDLNEESNQEIYNPNETGFIVNDDTFVKVNEGEFEFYVVGKANIIREFKADIEIINIEKEKEQESKKKENES